MLTVQGVVEAQDEGMFTCHASNLAGNDSADITLNVLSKQQYSVHDDCMREKQQ